MKQNLVSIIIPIYNNKQYFEQCINSIIEQSYKKIEIIIVDDGSTDGVQDLCDIYQEKDQRIKVFHRKNHGVSNSRNYGIDYSNGDFIMFVDGDDWLFPNSVETLLDAIVKKNVDIIQGGMCINDIVDDKIVKYEEVSNMVELKKSILNYHYKTNYNCIRNVCGKLYKSEIIKKNNIRFNDNIYLLEDGIFNFNILNYINKFGILSDTVYHYRKVQTSSSHRYNPDQLKQYQLIADEFKKLIGKDEIYNFYFQYMIFEFLMTYINRSSLYYEKYSVYRKNFLMIINSPLYLNCIRNINFREMILKEKVFYILIKFKMYYILYLICTLKSKIGE